MEPLKDILRAAMLRLRALFRKEAVERELDEELRFHLEMETARLVREGMEPEEAYTAARIRFGGVERFKEQARDARGTRVVEDGMQDLKYALRMLAKNPVFSAVAIVTLALGIGANAAIYTVVEAVLLEPLPFEDPHELALLYTRNDELNQSKYMVSPMDFDDWRNQNSTFESMAGFWPTTGTVTEAQGDPTRVNIVYTTEDYFEVMGASALRGRTFTEDDGPGSVQVIILSHGFWERRFGADPDLVGQSIILDGAPKEVVGVLRPEHTFPTNADMWINMTWTMQIQSRLARWMSAVGRLNDGTELATARADLVGVAGRIAQANPDSNTGWTAEAELLHTELVGDTRMALFVLLGATGLVLLIACANVANLLLSRSEVRAREIAVRTAFGAGRARLIRQLLTESLVLSGVGAIVGLGIAWVGVRGLLAIAPVTLPREGAITLDGTILLVVLGISVLTGLLFGLAPIARLVMSDVHSAIRDGARTTGSASRNRLQNIFVVAQLALAVVLVTGAGLLVQSFSNLRAVDAGFNTSGVLTMELDISTSVAEEDIDVINFYERFERRIGELPGVVAVGDATTLPLGEAHDYQLPFTLLERDLGQDIEPRAFLRHVAPGFFEAMRTPVVAGRAFDDRDRVDAPGAIVVNEAFVRRFLPGEDPVGARFGDLRNRYGPLGAVHYAGEISESEIIGVVKDVLYDGLRSDVQPAIFFSGLQSSVKRRTIVVRTTGAPASLLPSIRVELSSLSPSVALTNIQTMDDVMADAQARDRFSTLLLSLFGVVALLLAALGVYGVLAYAVAQRTGEVGIRMALGADRADVRGMVLKDGMRLVGIGIALGLVGAFAVSGLLASQLFGVNPRDPVVLGSVAGVLLLSGLLASLIPAWRATRVDPVVAMRAE